MWTDSVNHQLYQTQNLCIEQKRRNYILYYDVFEFALDHFVLFVSTQNFDNKNYGHFDNFLDSAWSTYFEAKFQKSFESHF